MLCEQIGLTFNNIRALLSGKTLSGDSAKLYSPEHERHFETKDIKLKIEKEPDNPEKLRLSLNGKNIIDWFREQFSRLKQTIKPRIVSTVLTMNLSHLEAANTEIHGLIGYEIYKDYDMLFDYSNNTLTLIQPTETEKYLDANYKQSKKDIFPIEMSEHIPTIKAKIGGMELNLGIDCGAGSNLIDVKHTESLRKYISESEETDLKGAGETKKVESGRLQTLTIGGKEFTNTLTVFNDMSHLNSNYEIELDGLIGYEILSKS